MTTLAAFLLCLLMFPFVCQAQPQNAPQRENVFKNPDGVPNYINLPNEKGKFAKPQKAPRQAGRLMEPSETYPPPGVKRMLLILFVIGAVFFYLIFLRGKLGLLFNSLKGIKEKTGKLPAKEKTAIKSVGEPVISIIHEKESSEKILRDMYYNLENEKQKKLTKFTGFSIRSAFSQLPGGANQNPELYNKGITVFESSSPALSRQFICSLLTSTARTDRKPILFTHRISAEEIAQAVFHSEYQKSWSELEESDRYRIQRMTEEFMDKYEAMPVFHKTPGDFAQWKQLITEIKKKHRVSAIIIDNLMPSDNMEFFEGLQTIASKENIPAFVVVDVKSASHNQTVNIVTDQTYILTEDSGTGIKIISKSDKNNKTEGKSSKNKGKDAAVASKAQ